MSDEYKIRNIDLAKLADHIRNKGCCTEEAALHLLDTIRCQRQEIKELQGALERIAKSKVQYVENERLKFERFATEPPFEKSVERWGNDPAKFAWPGGYVDISVSFAWEAWKAAIETR